MCLQWQGESLDGTLINFIVREGGMEQLRMEYCNVISDPQTGEVQQKREVGEAVRCLDISWGQLFLGTEGGCGARWNFKVRKLTAHVLHGVASRMWQKEIMFNDSKWSHVQNLLSSLALDFLRLPVI